MREPKKGEQLRFAATLRPPVCDREPAELDEPRLIGMKVQSKTSEPHLEIGKELLCLMPMLVLITGYGPDDSGAVNRVQHCRTAINTSLPI